MRGDGPDYLSMSQESHRVGKKLLAITFDLNMLTIKHVYKNAAMVTIGKMTVKGQMLIVG